MTIEERRKRQREYYWKNRDRIADYMLNWRSRDLENNRRKARESYYRKRDKTDREELRLKWRENKIRFGQKFTDEAKRKRRKIAYEWNKANPDRRKINAARSYERLKIRMMKDGSLVDHKKSVRKKYTERIKEDPVRRLKRIESRRRSYWKNKRPPTEKRKIQLRAWRKNKMRTDHMFKLRCLLSSRIKSALKKSLADKKNRTVALLGCDMVTLKNHIESLWKAGMNWGNYGLGVGKWNLDHIRPCASFNLYNDTEQKTCFHYLNLRPLWSIENLSKGSRWNGQLHFYDKTLQKGDRV